MLVYNVLLWTKISIICFKKNFKITLNNMIYKKILKDQNQTKINWLKKQKVWFDFLNILIKILFK